VIKGNGGQLDMTRLHLYRQKKEGRWENCREREMENGAGCPNYGKEMVRENVEALLC